MRYAEVSVNSRAAQRRTFSYVIPPGLNINVGQAVWVPFGSRVLQGIVIELTDFPAVEETRDIADTIDPQPLLSAERVELARWLSNYYLSPLFDAVATMLPPGFERRTVTFISATDREYDEDSLTQAQRHLLRLAIQHGRVSLNTLEKALGKKNARTAVTRLAGPGLVFRSYELEKSRIKPKLELFLSLKITPEEARQKATVLQEKRARKQAALLDFLAKQNGPVALSEARQNTGCDRAVAHALVKKRLVTIQQVEVRRQPFAHQGITPAGPLQLTPDQEAAFQAIRSALVDKDVSTRTFLLHGVTGSGKTEIYLQALAETIKQGKRGIVLVPEISLTPQTIERFAARFPGRVAVLHSQLSLRERFDEWEAIRGGDFDVVIGPRSAIFAPQPDLGLIVIDEEHEWTYKQQEQSPRYHARDVALKLADLTGAVVILGSATPDVETYYHAQRGNFRLLRLPERIVLGSNSALPRTETVDLREELKRGNRRVFSTALTGAIENVLVNREQAILFLNRRGAATSVQCRDCGHVMTCRRCDIPLTYHLETNSLVCHQCNRQSPVPQTCPECGSPRIRYIGIGTQKLEQEVKTTFPGARILRWDSDVTRGQNSHQAILDRVRNHEADILIGTQMVAKGLDLPLVTLVGVIIADTSLNLPDFRAEERTFQLICQVAGRTGRGVLGGRVIIQTYSPGNYAIQAAARHDYDLFYGQEIDYRRQLHNPPFSQLVSLTYSHTNDAACQKAAERMKRLVIEERDRQGITDLNLIGPAPAFVHRRRGRYRWQLILRGSNLSSFLSGILLPQGWTVDVDPLGL